MAYCTLDDVKTYLGITETTDDALIEQAILAAKQAIDMYCGMAFDVTTDTTRYYSAVSVLISGRSLHLARFCLAEAPTSVTVGGVDVTSAVKVYGTAPYWELVLSGTSGYSWGTTNGDVEDAIAITGKWGYSTTATDDVKMAAIIWSSFLYQQKDVNQDGTAQVGDTAITTSPGYPVNATALLRRYLPLW